MEEHKRKCVGETIPDRTDTEKITLEAGPSEDAVKTPPDDHPTDENGCGTTGLYNCEACSFATNNGTVFTQHLQGESHRDRLSGGSRSESNQEPPGDGRKRRGKAGQTRRLLLCPKCPYSTDRVVYLDRHSRRVHGKPVGKKAVVKAVRVKKTVKDALATDKAASKDEPLVKPSEAALKWIKETSNVDQISKFESLDPLEIDKKTTMELAADVDSVSTASKRSVEVAFESEGLENIADIMESLVEYPVELEKEGEKVVKISTGATEKEQSSSEAPVMKMDFESRWVNLSELGTIPIKQSGQSPAYVPVPIPKYNCLGVFRVIYPVRLGSSKKIITGFLQKSPLHEKSQLC
jgi:hypothetical protein